MMANRRSREDLKEKLADDTLSFLQHQMSDEERRREVIEGKTGQLLGQVSIVVSVISLFIPLISEQVGELVRWQKVSCVALFLVVVVVFIVSIWIASTSWIINRYGYIRPDLSDIYENGSPRTHLEFVERHIKILQVAIPQHVELNNEKGTRLIRAGMAFRLGTLLMGVLVVWLSLLLSVAEGHQNEMRVEEPLKIVIQNSVNSVKPIVPKDTVISVNAPKH